MPACLRLGPQVSALALSSAWFLLSFLSQWNTGNEKLYFGTGTSLTVIPNIQGSDPAVYQLRGSKSSNISVCLFTDFNSSLSVTKPSEPSVFFTDKTVVDMKAIRSRSNGALAWSSNKNFACNETFNEGSFYSSSGIACDAKLIEKSFETDMNLNFQNLSVIGLRILLLKVVAFNLLMTLQLWSS